MYQISYQLAKKDISYEIYTKREPGVAILQVQIVSSSRLRYFLEVNALISRRKRLT